MAKIGNCLKKSAIYMGILYLLFCGIVFFKPQWFFYHPDMEPSKLEIAVKNGYPAEQVAYKSADGTPLYAWYTKPGVKKKIIVFMHGNSFNIEKFYHKLIPLMQAGYGTFLPEYRGFGNVPGVITQQNLGSDALAAVNYLHSQGYQNQDIIMYGMSLGSYLATNSVYTLGQEQSFAGLILEVPFDSLYNVVKKVVPVPLPLNIIIRDKFDNLNKIAEVKTPILVMGAANDATVPVSLAENLYAHAAEPKKLIIYQDGAHSNLYNFHNYRDILEWLEANEKTGR